MADEDMEMADEDRPVDILVDSITLHTHGSHWEDVTFEMDDVERIIQIIKDVGKPPDLEWRIRVTTSSVIRHVISQFIELRKDRIDFEEDLPTMGEALDTLPEDMEELEEEMRERAAEASYELDRKLSYLFRMGGPSEVPRD